jgi:hypothetical protein
MKNKNLLIGGAIVAGLLFLLFRKKPTTTTEGERIGGGDAGLGGGGGGGGAIAQENGGGAIMQTGQPILVAPINMYRPLPPDRVNNTLRPLPITRPAVSPRPNDVVSANINQSVSNATNLRNFLTFNGMDDGKVNGLDFSGDLD